MSTLGLFCMGKAELEFVGVDITRLMELLILGKETDHFYRGNEINRNNLSAILVATFSNKFTDVAECLSS